jgi:hypothetical protein
LSRILPSPPSGNQLAIWNRQSSWAMVMTPPTCPDSPEKALPRPTQMRSEEGTSSQWPEIARPWIAASTFLFSIRIITAAALECRSPGRTLQKETPCRSAARLLKSRPASEGPYVAWDIRISENSRYAEMVPRPKGWDADCGYRQFPDRFLADP